MRNIAVCALLACTGSAFAGSVAVNTNPGTLNVTTALTGFATSGDMMAGMTVVFTFDDASVVNGVWATTGVAAGGVSLSAGLSLVGDTFLDPWTLTNTSGKGLVSVALDGAPGNTIFDIILDPFLTDGSARGKPFQVTSGLASYDIVATYSNLIALIGDAPLGDLYRNLFIDFGQMAFATGDVLQFLADTDNAALPDDIRPIPLPTTAGLGMVGLLAISSRRRR